MKGIAGVVVLVIAAAVLNCCRAEKQDLDSAYVGERQKEDKHATANRLVRELRDFRRSNGWMTPYILARQFNEEMQQQPINPPKRSMGDGNFDEIDLSGLDTFNHNAKRMTLYGASGNYICKPIGY